MAFHNPDKNPLPFYKLEGTVWTNIKPLWFRNECGDHNSHIYAPSKNDFQLMLNKEIMAMSDITAVNVRSVDDNEIVPGVAISRSVYLDPNDNKFLAISVDLADVTLKGNYYISVDTTLQKYYSERFCVMNLSDDIITIEYAAKSKKVGNLIYPEGFKHTININAEIIPQEPQIEEETIEDGYGQEKPVLQILTQSFVFSFVAPNYFAQALSAISLHDQFNVINRKVGNNSLEFDENIKSVQGKSTPEDNSCFSFVEVTYVKETVIKTACIDDIRALNNPPEVSIYWQNTMTAEDRECTIQDGCENTIAIETLFDPDGNLDTYEWESSSDGGDTWTPAGSNATLTVDPNTADIYSYRLRAVDTFGAIGYSNILSLRVNDVQTSNYFASTSLITSNCVNQGKAFEMNVIGSNPTVKLNVSQLYNFSHGYELTINDELGNELMSIIETTQSADVTLPLDNGAGIFEAQLCLRPCLNISSPSVILKLELYENDGVTLTGRSFNIKLTGDC